jgi:methyl-accepting chemotaxis protein
MDRLPGKRAETTAAVDSVKQSIEAISSEVNALVSAAARGDFSARGDEQRYAFAFREMVEGLNQLMQTSDSGLSEVARVLAAIAAGDLTESMSGSYQGTFAQLQEDTNATVASLRSIIGEIREATEAIKVASSEIAAGNSDLSARTEQQAASLEETAASMEELTATVQQNTEHARQANSMTASAGNAASEGGQIVAAVVQTMDQIHDSSKRITDIIGVIDGIAFQTNILALNAAVEAARAGEQGRGFAVVATEVRSLAQRSAGAAKEIKALIADSAGKVETGSRLVNTAGEKMEHLVTSVQRVTEIMSQITEASIEQSSGIEQVGQAVTQMDQVTQQNAALVEQAAAAAESMEEQARNLSAAVSRFRLLADGGQAPNQSTRRLAGAGAGRPLRLAGTPR